jgi:plasmid stabilization system protein ParE
VAPDLGHAGIPELAQTMMLEWSDEALADLDRFVEFLHRDHPALAATVANEIIDKVQVLSEHP